MLPVSGSYQGLVTWSLDGNAIEEIDALISKISLGNSRTIVLTSKV